MKKLFVCFLSVAMVFAFTAPLMAADWNFYGNTRFQTFSADYSKDGADSDRDTVWLMQNNTRFGGKVAAGDISGHLEVNAVSETAGGGNNIGLRHISGTWNFGAGSLLIGHTWAVITNLLSNQAANQGQGLLGYGSVYQNRRDQIRLTFGGFKIGLLAPTTSALTATVTGTTAVGVAGPLPVFAFETASGDVDVSLPKIELAYRFATDMFWIEPYLGWQSYDVQYSAADSTTDVTSLVYGLKGKVNFGPGYFGAAVSGGTNPTEYGLYGTGQQSALVGSEMKDVSYLEYMLNLGFKLSDMWTFEAGYGSQTTALHTATKVEMDRNAYYIQADISLAPGVHLIPEYSMISQGDTKSGATTTDNGQTTYIGAKWQINF
jgi:hypothetical protein